MLVAMAGTLGGCEELEDFLPTVDFDTLDVEAIDFEGAEVDFVFAVNNPNPVDVGLSSFSYDFALAQVPLFDGDNEDGFDLVALGASELRLPVALNWQSTWESVQATRGQDEVGFGLGGHFGFDTPAGEARLPYQEEGSFPALRTPKFRLSNLRATRFNLLQGSAGLDLEVAVDNAHGSTLCFDRFDYGIDINGQSLATGLVNTFEVDGATEGTITLPIDINLLTAGSTIVSAISGGGQLDVGLGADMDVETPFGILPLSIQQQDALSVLNDL
jgi:LEA14-like dessication related protein